MAFDVLSFVMGQQAAKGSGGSGGGALAPGVYWEQIMLPVPSGYPSRHFMLNGDWYLWQLTSANGPGCKYYKFVDDQYSEILATDSYATPSGSCIVFKNQYHMASQSYHYTFDGNTQVRLNNFPKSEGILFVYNGELYYSVSASTNTPPYKWNSDTDEWVASDIPWNIYTVVFEYGGKLYGCKDNLTLYKLENGEYVDLGNTSSMIDVKNRFVDKDGHLWIPSSGSTGFCYKFDSVNNTLVEMFKRPYCGASSYAYEYAGQIRFQCLSSGNAKIQWGLHLIE